MPRFVIQQHSLQEQVHWDLMLERGQSLATWQVEREPVDWIKGAIPCRKIFDHRRKYLTYEGSVRGERGQVHIAGSGEYYLLEITENYWRVSLVGDTIGGILELKRVEEELWMLHFQGEIT